MRQRWPAVDATSGAATSEAALDASGSPMIDGEGRLVGVNFDRVWENVANDFGHNPDIARNVSVDVRYLLWLPRKSRARPICCASWGAGRADRYTSPQSTAKAELDRVEGFDAGHSASA